MFGIVPYCCEIVCSEHVCSLHSISFVICFCFRSNEHPRSQLVEEIGEPASVAKTQLEVPPSQQAGVDDLKVFTSNSKDTSIVFSPVSNSTVLDSFVVFSINPVSLAIHYWSLVLLGNSTFLQSFWI